MADTAYSRGSLLRGQPIDFISRNPTVDAYREGQKFDLAQETGELANHKTIQDLDFNEQANPSRLRKISADADITQTQARFAPAEHQTKLEGARLTNEGTAESNRFAVLNNPSRLRQARADADVAEGTVQPRIQSNVAAARTATAGADVAAGAVPYDIQRRAADASTAQSTARSSASDATVKENTENTRIQKENVGLRRAEADLATAQQHPLLKVIDLIEAGQVEAAQELSRRTLGNPIPDAVINSAQYRRTVAGIVKQAQANNPNSPAAQQQEITAQLADVARKQQAGQPLNPVTQPYARPEGVPELPETTAKPNYHLYPAKRTGPDGKPEEGYLRHDSTSHDLPDFVSGTTIQSRTGGAGGGRPSVWEMRRGAIQALYGAGSPEEAAFLKGTKVLSEAEMVQAAEKAAAAEAAKNRATDYNPARRAQDKEQIKARILADYRAAAARDAARLQPGPTPAPAAPPPAARPAPTAAPSPAPAAPAPASPAPSATPPQRPPSVPPGSAFSPSRGLWKSPDGRIFDRNGQPVR